MRCWIRACKFRDKETDECIKFLDIDDLFLKFKEGNICAWSWVLSGRLPARTRQERKEGE